MAWPSYNNLCLPAPGGAQRTESIMGLVCGAELSWAELGWAEGMITIT